MTSADENSALKRNTVHQTRLSLELQQLEKDRTTRLREMEKATQAFARRQEQIQGIRDKASLRRVPSAPVQSPSGCSPRSKSALATDSNEDSTLQPFITKVRLESAPASTTHRRLHKTATMPSFDLLPSRTGSNRLSGSFSPLCSNPTQRGTTPNKPGFVSPLQNPNSSRVPIYSRNFSGLRQRDGLVTAGLPTRKSSLPELNCSVKNRRSKSVSS